MLSFQELREMCYPPLEGKAYYRPFICNGDLEKVEIFFVGINPATLIFPEDMEIDNYVNLLLDYEKFIKYYKELRLKNDKDEFSRTRIGMNAFFSSLRAISDVGIIETDVIPYPTANLKLLKKEPRYISEQGKEIFFQLVMKFTPRMLIFHGKKSIDNALEIFASKGLIPQEQINLEEKIEEMEKLAALLEFEYPNGKKGVIMACRHFMYYGSRGESFKGFREKVLKIISSW